MAYGQKGLPYIPDPVFYNALRENAFKFSGAKTFQQVREMSDIVATEPTFASFQKSAKRIFDDYNKVWLRTEYDQAFNGSQMASNWQNIELTSEELPLLKYDTVGDKRVRPEHKAMDNIIRPVNDPFWDKFYPPNGWRCRCDVQQLSSGDLTDLEKRNIPEILPEFEINTGKQKILFSPEHPYFIVGDQFQKLKQDNFNLPAYKPKNLGNE